MGWGKIDAVAQGGEPSHSQKLLMDDTIGGGAVLAPAIASLTVLEAV
jgi:hypothetical protein